MTLVDTSILLYAAIESFEHHQAASRWLRNEIASGSRVGLPWESLVSFVRIANNPRVFSKPIRVGALWKTVDTWLNFSNVWIPTPTEDHRTVFSELLKVAASKPGDIPDAHLAALAISNGLTLITADGGFRRFPGLRYKNPLAT